ncbi:beta-lactamase [Bacillus sp. OxB-1]|uniref:serine hydrolase domain-containing protein n=1 Tax=Bacillus sp. (strain OxB-1) TaxID=98228 RepID=UPI000581F70D|nr:serine hydrolase domain-containing protein [Bacillus sp. OxB-1]BAQ09084.1 beta-lactamase [Bacillus sp. OxB-1]
MTREQVEASIEHFFKKRVKKDPKIHNSALLVHSEKLDIDVQVSEGENTHHPRQPYYIASVSKLVTAVLVGMLEERSLLSFEDPISKYIDADLMKDLHVYKRVDYSEDIRVKHLLNHTSGLHDFVEEQPKQGKSIIDMLLEEPTHKWTPREVIEWAKQHFVPHFPPGEGFHYSDTGYHLLGLIVEKATGMSLGKNLQTMIFQPLGMTQTYLVFSDAVVETELPVARLYMRNEDITDHTSLSLLYAGGGIVSTTQDLLLFMKALVHHQLVNEKTLAKMKSDWSKFFVGIDYGYGVMNFKTVPILMPAKYNVWGNAGSTGSFLFYHPQLDAYVIGSFNHFRHDKKGIRFMLQVIDKLVKGEKKLTRPAS